MTSSLLSPSSVFLADRAVFEQTMARALAHDMDVFLRYATQQGQRGFALINVLQCHDTGGNDAAAGPIADWARCYGLEPEKLFRHTPEASLMDIGPWLVELPASSPDRVDVTELLQDLAKSAGLVQGLSLLSSPLRADHLAGHLRSWLHGTILPDPDIPDDDTMGAMLRWFDPRVGFDMVSLWPAQERHQFLRAFTWCGWDIDFTPVGHRCSAGRTPQRADRVGRLPLDKALLIAMAGLNSADDLLADVLDEVEPKTFAAIAPALLRWIAAHQDVTAASLGITDRESRITWLQHALTLHPGLSQLPGLHEHLSREAPTGRSLAHVLAAQTSGWWQTQRDAAPAVWAQWASRFLNPLIDRQSLAPSTHPYAALLQSSAPQPV